METYQYKINTYCTYVLFRLSLSTTNILATWSLSQNNLIPLHLVNGKI